MFFFFTFFTFARDGKEKKNVTLSCSGYESVKKNAEIMKMAKLLCMALLQLTHSESRQVALLINWTRRNYIC